MYSILLILITNIERLLWLTEEMLHSTFLYFLQYYSNSVISILSFIEVNIGDTLQVCCIVSGC